MMQDEIKKAVKRAEELAKIASAIDDCLEGLSHEETISILSSIMHMKIAGNDHEYESGVISEIAMVFAKMIVSYKFMNSLNEDDDDEEEEMIKQ